MYACGSFLSMYGRSQHNIVITTQLTNVNICMSKASWCVWTRGASGLVDAVKHMMLPVVGGPHPISWRPE